MFNTKHPFLPHWPSTQACPPVHASTVAEHLQMLFVASQKDAETSSTHELAVPHLQTKSVSVPSQVSGDWHAGLHAKTCQCIILIFATHFLYLIFYVGYILQKCKTVKHVTSTKFPTGVYIWISRTTNNRSSFEKDALGFNKNATGSIIKWSPFSETRLQAFFFVLYFLIVRVIVVVGVFVKVRKFT